MWGRVSHTFKKKDEIAFKEKGVLKTTSMFLLLVFVLSITILFLLHLLFVGNLPAAKCRALFEHLLCLFSDVFFFTETSTYALKRSYLSAI